MALCNLKGSENMSKKLYFGGDIITMDDKKPYVQSMLIENDKIIAVGDYNDLSQNADEKINLNGKTVIPAFIDAHSHFSSYAISLLQPSASNCKSFDDILNVIDSYIKQNNIEKDKWITVKDFDPNELKEKRYPDCNILDKFENPILLEHKSGHTGVFNSAALKKLNIDINTPVPEGGKIEQKNGKLTGYIEENALITYMQKMPMPTMEEIEEAYLKAQERYASYGITTAQEGMIMDAMDGMFELLCNKKLLKIDLIGYLDLRNCDKTLNMFSEHINKYREHFKIGGYKVFLDGSPQAKTAWLTKPYKNSDYCGYPTLTDDMLYKHIKRAINENKQILAHCNGDAAAEQYLTVFENLNCKKDIRPVMIHAQMLRADQLPRLKKVGMIPSFFIAHVYHWGDTHIKNLGIERASQISCANSALKNNILFTFHQDSPVIEPNMLETIWCAVNRKTKAGIVLGENQKISVIEALKAVTINAAYQYFEEGIKGSIEVGKQADFIILNENPIKVNPDKIKDILVLETIKNGEIIYKKSI